MDLKKQHEWCTEHLDKLHVAIDMPEFKEHEDWLVHSAEALDNAHGILHEIFKLPTRDLPWHRQINGAFRNSAERKLNLMDLFFVALLGQNFNNLWIGMVGCLVLYTAFAWVTYKRTIREANRKLAELSVVFGELRKDYEDSAPGTVRAFLWAKPEQDKGMLAPGSGDS